MKYVKTKLPRVNELQNDYSSHTPAWLSSIRHHANRCRFVADNLAILAKQKVDASKREDIEAKIEDCKAKIRHFLRVQADNPALWYSPGEPLEPNGPRVHRPMAEQEGVAGEPLEPKGA